MAMSKSGQLRIIAGKWRGRKIKFIDREDLRPTPDRVRETLFNWLRSDLSGAICLDLFAGSGALGFEAASRGAQLVTMVDNSNQACKMIQENIRLLKSESVETETLDALHYLEKNQTQYDVVFLDPPYKLDILPQLFLLLEQKKCLAEHAKIYIEHDVKTNLPKMPDNWHLLKDKKAGQVSYVLIGRTKP